MAITRVGSATGTTSATLPSHQAGDLIVGFAFRDGSNTAPTVPTGKNWTTASSGGANTCSGVLVWKVAASSSETTGTFTNATSVVFVVYRGTHLTAPIGTISTMSGATSTVAWPALTLTKTDSGSWIVGVVGSRSTNTTIDSAPTGLTNVTSVLDATDEAAAHDTNGGVASWSSTNQSIGGTASGWFGRLFEILPAPNLASGPGLQDLTNAIAQIEAGLQSLKRGYAAAGGEPAALPQYWNPSDKDPDITVSGDRKSASVGAGVTEGLVRGTVSQASAKKCFEVVMVDIDNYSVVGVADAGASLGFIGVSGQAVVANNGQSFINGGSGSYGSGWIEGDTVTVALDAGAQRLYIAVNNSWIGGGDPVAGTGGIDISAITGPYYPIGGHLNGPWQQDIKTSAADLIYSPPSGYSAWE